MKLGHERNGNAVSPPSIPFFSVCMFEFFLLYWVGEKWKGENPLDTLRLYSSGVGSCGGGREIICFSCGGSHPWSEFIDGKHVVKCPNRLNPGVTENVTKAIGRMHKNRKQHSLQNSKKQNLATTNFTDFDEASQQRIRDQVL